jgi:hypothetical protein
MRLATDGTHKGSPTEGTLQSGGLLSPDELALPAICGQTGKAFLMVARRQGRGVLELTRAIALEAVPSVTGMPVAVHLATPASTPRSSCSVCGRKLDPTWTFCSVCGRKLLPQPQAHAAPSRGAAGSIPKDPGASFQALNMSARIQIGSLYDGCPCCRATGYFHCGCGIFSCWNEHNRKPHLDHTDVWCAACQLWICTSNSDESDEALSELTAYAERENSVDQRSRIGLESKRRDEIGRTSSIKGYLD